MKKNIFILSLVFVFLMTSCSSKSENIQLKKAELRIQELEKKISKTKGGEKDNVTLINAALDVAELLKNNDYETLSSRYIDVDEGLTFSPVPYIDLENDVHFTAAEVANLLSNTSVYTWTKRTPSGNPVEETYKEYAISSVNDHDYTNPHIIGNNRVVCNSNMESNISDIYPSSEFISLHFKGFDASYEGMDWTSLRLIFKKIDGKWKLLNINHAHWTP